MCLPGRKVSAHNGSMHVRILRLVPWLINNNLVRHAVFKITKAVIVRLSIWHYPILDGVPHIRVCLDIPRLIDVDSLQYS